jgi:hypothetical protein
MSYISAADAAAIRAPSMARMKFETKPARLHTKLPVGPVLEVVLMVATSVVVSLVVCTTFAGALLH